MISPVAAVMIASLMVPVLGKIHIARADERLTGATDVLVHVTDILNYCKELVSLHYKILASVYFMKITATAIFV